MKTITIRGISPEMDQAIKKKARERNLSMNEWLLRMLRQGTGLTKKPMFAEHHDLDSLAGSWSERQAEEFLKEVAGFEKIDQDMWK